MQDPTIECYRGLSGVYDRLMSPQKYTVWRQMISDTISKYRIPKQVALDIACGTGVISEMLDENGFQVVGINLSSEMLKFASNRLPNAVFYQDDIRTYQVGEHGITLAVSFYDSLNYLLTDEDMLACFKRTHAALAEGGIFLFDMNSRDHVYASQRGAPKICDDGDCFSIFRYSGAGRIWILDIDLFFHNESGYYSRNQERHTERGYDREDIIPLLEAADFTVLETTCETKVYEDGLDRPSRLYFTARK